VVETFSRIGGHNGLVTEIAREAPTAPRPPIADRSDGQLADLERFRVELTAYCYRMLGSAFEAEDGVQETFIRAWRAIDRFEGRSSLRSWLYRIATNVCLDMLGASQRRARPVDLNPAGTADGPLDPGLPESAWVEPVPDARVLPTAGDPADVAIARESVRLAFVAALQNLPPRQRAVLILREVLHWKAEEVAELLGTTVASVNSALQRARATLGSRDLGGADAKPLDDEQQALLDRYVRAFESYDMSALTAVLRDDAEWSMPPYELWLQTHDDIVRWCLGPGVGCRDSRLIPTSANGMPAFGQYKPDPDGGWAPWSLQVLDLEPDGSAVRAITFFLDTERFFPLFGLPPRVD
jgi:RNA polymerase sigma-70 factor (ECF subfamily)